MEPTPISRGKGATVLVYGIPGSGKTRLIGSAESALILRPPMDHTDSIPLPAAGIEEKVLDDWSGVYELFQWGQQGGFEKYDWVWIDSLSLMQDVLLDDVLEDAIMRKPTRAIKKGGVSVPEYGSDKGEYKINFDRIRKVVGDMVGLSKAGMFNFGITCHPFEWWDPTKEEDVWAPWVQGKNMSPKICGYMNIVAYLSATEKEGKRKETLMVDAPGFVGKDQLNCFPELKSGRHGFVNPTLADIEAAINQVRKPQAGTRKGKPRTKKTAASRKTRTRRK